MSTAAGDIKAGYCLTRWKSVKDHVCVLVRDHGEDHECECGERKGN